MAHTKSSVLDQCADSAYVNAHRDQFGKKTTALAILVEKGFPVPAFVAFNAATVLALSCGEISDTYARALVENAHAQLGATRYAVRSSAFVEDSHTESHAGEFISLVDVVPEGLLSAVIKVIADAKGKGYVSEEKPFSIIIQTFVEGEYGGVIFTRDPLGGREAIIEWRDGRVDEVVGGGDVARVYVNDDHYHATHPQFPQMNELFATARRIEMLFGSAQDIEWVVHGNTVSILQSRPITTLHPSANETYRNIDDLFKDRQVYFLSRTGVGESFAVVTPLALDILKTLYAKDGPIERVYRSHNIRVQMDDVFVVVCGVLYVDKIRELHQFFPAYDYVPDSGHMAPRITRFGGLWTSIVNGRKLAKLDAPRVDELNAKIAAHTRFVLAMHGEDAAAILSAFAAAYEDIFAINLYAEQVFRDAERALTECPHRLSALLSLPLREQGSANDEPIPGEFVSRLVGNSVNISDHSSFVLRDERHAPSPELLTWWNGISATDRARLTRDVVRAQEFQSLREGGRILTVLFINALRNALAASFSGDLALMYEARLSELMGGNIDMSELHARSLRHKQAVAMHMPDFIATVPPQSSSPSLGVSPGIASGIVRAAHAEGDSDTILFVPRLTPDLAPLLGAVRGIIASEGGLLSHMAIVSREAGVPVVIEPRFKEKFAIGDRVMIDGSLGTIARIHSAG